MCFIQFSRTRGFGKGYYYAQNCSKTRVFGRSGGGKKTIFHGHGTIVTAEAIGKNFGVYQGVTIGNNIRAGCERTQPIIGDNVTVYANAVVAGGITIGDDASIGTDTIVMKDVPSHSIVYGNPCIIKSKAK